MCINIFVIEICIHVCKYVYLYINNIVVAFGMMVHIIVKLPKYFIIYFVLGPQQ